MHPRRRVNSERTLRARKQIAGTPLRPSILRHPQASAFLGVLRASALDFLPRPCFSPPIEPAHPLV